MNKSSKSKSDGKLCSNNSMMHMGMDLHKNYLQIAVMDEKGKVIRNSKIDNYIQKIGTILTRSKIIKRKMIYYLTSMCFESKLWYKNKLDLI